MPFKRPTLTQIDDRIRNDIAGRMQLGNSSRTTSLFRRSTVGILSRVYAGACHLLYGFQEWLSRQRFVHLMESEFLDAEGLTYDIPRKLAKKSSGICLTKGNDGYAVPIGTIYQRSDGIQYEATESTAIAGGSGTVTVRALVAGVSGNVPKGVLLSAVASLDGIYNQIEVADAGLTGGVDQENDEYYRERILDRKREPPHGGNRNDYVQWALQVPGVTRAWSLPLWMGNGTVGVMFACDDSDDAFPDAKKCREVWEHIEPLRPVTAEVTVFSPVRHLVDVTVSVSPDSDETREAVRAEIEDFILREGDPEKRIYVSRLSEAISAAIGEHHHYLIMPANDIAVAKNAIPVLGELVFVNNANGGF